MASDIKINSTYIRHSTPLAFINGQKFDPIMRVIDFSYYYWSCDGEVKTRPWFIHNDGARSLFCSCGIQQSVIDVAESQNAHVQGRASLLH